MNTSTFATYPHIPPSDYWRRRWTASIIVVIHLFWAGLKVFTAVGKLIEFSDFEFVRHYTNWSWVAQAMLAVPTIGVMLVQVGWLRHDGWYSRFAQFVIALLYFPVLGIVMTVRVLVWILLGTKAGFLKHFLKHMAPSYVILGDDAFHFLPVVEILLFTFIYRKFICYSVNGLITRTRMLESPARFTLYIFYSALGFTAVTLIVYRLLFNPHQVYMTRLPDIFGLTAIFVTLILFVLLPMLFMLWLLGVGLNIPYTVEWLHRNDADPRVVAQYSFVDEDKTR